MRCAGCLLGFCPECIVRAQVFFYCRRCASSAFPTAEAAGAGGFDFDDARVPGAAAPPRSKTTPAERAGLGARVVAFAIDALVIGFVVVPIVSHLDSSPLLVLAAVYGIPVLYEALFVQQTGQTLGKAAAGISVVSADGGPATDAQAWGRAVVKIGQLACCGLPFLGALFVADGRSLHDQASGTYVARGK